MRKAPHRDDSREESRNRQNEKENENGVKAQRADRRKTVSPYIFERLKYS